MNNPIEKTNKTLSLLDQIEEAVKSMMTNKIAILVEQVIQLVEKTKESMLDILHDQLAIQEKLEKDKANQDQSADQG